METNDSPQIKAGDLLYAVGPGHNPPHSATDLVVYSTMVKAVRKEGSPSAKAAPQTPDNTWLVIELGSDRPHLGFPFWVYKSYAIGFDIHRSRAGALRAFTAQARQRHDKAERERDLADKEIQWALTAAEASAEGRP